MIKKKIKNINKIRNLDKLQKKISQKFQKINFQEQKKLGVIDVPWK